MRAEFKKRHGKLFPIEFNVLRFGGKGGADVSDYAFGINAYVAFF
jgi:hypothetical protein